MATVTATLSGSNSNALMSVAGVNNWYFDLLPPDHDHGQAWNGLADDTARGNVCIRATRYIVDYLRPVHTKAVPDQALPWPDASSPADLQSALKTAFGIMCGELSGGWKPEKVRAANTGRSKQLVHLAPALPAEVAALLVPDIARHPGSTQAVMSW